MKKFSRIFLFVLTLTMAYSPVRAINWEQVRNYTCIGAAFAAVAGIIYTLCKSETNEHMLERIQTDYDNASFLMSYVQRYESTINSSPYNLSEDQLYTVLHTSLNNTDIDALICQVNRILGDLTSGKRELETRIRKNTKSKTSATIEAMKILVNHISERQNRINITLKALLDAHGNYFKTIQYYHTLMAQYTHEISVLNNYQHNTNESYFYLKSIVNNKGNVKQYPFMRYYNELTQDHEKLQKCIAQLSPIYAEIIAKTQQLLEGLKYIQSIIATSPEYSRDVLQKQQDEIQAAQRQLAIQQEQFAREQERARYDLRMAQIDLAIQQMAFRKECAEELKKLKAEREELQRLLDR